MALDPNRWTIKTQEAVQAALDAARTASNPELTPDHLLARAPAPGRQRRPARRAEARPGAAHAAQPGRRGRRPSCPRPTAAASPA